MVGTLFTALVTALSLLIVDIVVPGVNLANFPSALIAGLVIGLINASVKPVLSTLSLPLNFLTLGAFSLIINGLCFWLAAVLVPGFAVRGIIAFILGPVILSFSSTLLNKYFAEKNLALTSGDINTRNELPSR
ncbi:MAG: phage holin family protein [Cyanomargarita calcarea GSE-NOS-MK-12-04C]|jgi:putative membrane protein|uniref:Phage holin family protein n=1 Tax=Cyanomargarita calcarea GSE-NOS-MK-12-04C TaxID=2839659 RepID=A0A951UWH4_9CYAN|nr:phage holin family protein [Cyanomargarita calcarea GSE-NOS-MK-12-04C]